MKGNQNRMIHRHMHDSLLPNRVLRRRALLLAAAAMLMPVGSGVSQGTPPAPDGGTGPSYAGSATCEECHLDIYRIWSRSHHALAERWPDLDRDARAFEGEDPFQHGSQTSQVRKTGERFEVLTQGPQGKTQPFTVARIFGHDPLRQLLVDFGAGRFQVTELAWEPATGEWFDVFGDEDRRSGEWGHWTGRGMNWNSMCATCHNTAVRKNYDVITDSYDTTLSEYGVGCEACHGPLADHVSARSVGLAAPDATPDAAPARFSKDRVLDTCGTCHARRSDLTESFRPGDIFLDHHSPVLPGLSDTYYPDGQVQAENFEYVSFLSSRMHSEGVRCGDCHDPHSGALFARGNDLCLSCHAGKIDPDSHSHHVPDTAGHGCVDCHMPITVYMDRDPRRDHGFTVPDPDLTLEMGVPNACGRCHVDRSPAWIAEKARAWYGDRLDRHTASRARLIGKARAGEANLADEILALLAKEPSPLWRAVIVSIAEVALADPRVRSALIAATKDTSPLVRERATRALEPLILLGDADSAKAVRDLLEDPLRAVRVAAAWALRGSLEDGTAREELAHFLDLHEDQPTGAWQKAVYHMAEGDVDSAVSLLRRATTWDKGSPVYPHDLAVVLAGAGKSLEAREVLEQAAARITIDAALWISLALARNETGDLEGAMVAFEAALSVDSDNARAWYNLGLARSVAGDDEGALKCLARCQVLAPWEPDAPWARATILYRLGRGAEAIQALQTVLRLVPEYPGARELLGILMGR
jgi:predicted CXXCH cytochrome family protein